MIKNGVKKIVFAAKDPDQSEETQHRLKEANIEIRQVEDPEIIQKSLDIFNSSVQDPQKRKPLY